MLEYKKNQGYYVVLQLKLGHYAYLLGRNIYFMIFMFQLVAKLKLFNGHCLTLRLTFGVGPRIQISLSYFSRLRTSASVMLRFFLILEQHFQKDGSQGH